MIFVACPYWHESEEIRNYRRAAAIKYSSRLAKLGVLNYSPLAYTGNKSAPEVYWIEHGLKMIETCDEIHVLCLDGWRESSGVKGEIKKGERLELKIRYIEKHERLAFCGSRPLKCQKTKDLILREIENHQASTIITHGEPDGVCRKAIEVSRQNGYALKLHHLKPKKHAAGKYEHRSIAVLNDCDFCVFLHDGKSKGTRNELELAQKMGIPYSYYVLVNGEYVLQKPEEAQAPLDEIIAAINIDMDDILAGFDYVDTGKT